MLFRSGEPDVDCRFSQCLCEEVVGLGAFDGFHIFAACEFARREADEFHFHFAFEFGEDFFEGGDDEIGRASCRERV